MRRIFQKPVFSLFLLFIILAISGCGSPKTVPDKTLEWAIEDFLKNQFTTNETIPEYTYQAVHTTDASTKTDTVHISLEVTSPTFTAISECDTTYVYDKSSELWSILRSGEWKPLQITRYNISSDRQVWLNTFEKAFSDLYIDIDDSHIVAYDGEKGNRFINQAFGVDSGISRWTTLSTPFNFDCYVLGNEKDAKTTLQKVLDLNTTFYEDNWLELKDTQIGENYEINTLKGKITIPDILTGEPDRYDQYGYIIRIDSNVYVIRLSCLDLDPDYKETELFDNAMQDMGFHGLSLDR